MMLAKVLVVDDEELIRLSLRKLLEKNGFEVDVAGSADEALKKLDENGFGVVITDIMMPDMDGIELLRRIKEKDSSIYVIMITAYASLDRAIASLKHGANDFIKKPYENREIVEAVRKGMQVIEEEAKAKGEEPPIQVRREVAEGFRRIAEESARTLSGALCRIMRCDVVVKVSHPQVTPVSRFPEVAGEEQSFTGTFSAIYGELSGSVSLLFPGDDAGLLVEMLTGRRVERAEAMDREDRTVVQEIGSILTGEAVKRLGNMLRMKLKLTPASFVTVTSKSFGSFLELRGGKRKRYCFTHRMSLSAEGREVHALLVFVFDLRNLLEVLNSAAWEKEQAASTDTGG